MVNLRELYTASKNELEKAGIEFPAFDTLCIFEKVFGFTGRGYLAVHGGEEIDPEKADECRKLIAERKKRPLQYILGRWEFMGREFFVGEGVLIPREDTAVLVNAACGFIGGKSAKVLDLCAGSGAVGISVALGCENTSVDEAEISPAAMEYLEKNIKALCPDRVRAFYADVLKAPETAAQYDVIVSNPPYIVTDDIENLSKDVRCEPKLALDGGEDGLVFYRAILENYLPLLRDGGFLAVEVGINQAEEVAEMMRAHGLADICAHKDMGGIDRVICGVKKIFN